jgi:hypothetical protein
MIAKTMPATAIQEDTQIREADHKKAETEKRNTHKLIGVNVN